MNHNTHSKGEIAQLKIELAALEKGYLVSKPTRHESRYDCIIDDGSKLIKTQVKYASGKDKRTDGGVRVELKKKHKNHYLTYSASDIDLVLVYVPKIDKILAFGPDKFVGKSVIYVRLEKAKNGHPSANWFEDFLW